MSDNEQRKKALDELTRLSEETGMYECSHCGLYHSPSRDCDVYELRRRYDQLLEVFAHHFVDPARRFSGEWLKTQGDPHGEKCLQCGLNIRHEIHLRK